MRARSQTKRNENQRPGDRDYKFIGELGARAGIKQECFIFYLVVLLILKSKKERWRGSRLGRFGWGATGRHDVGGKDTRNVKLANLLTVKLTKSSQFRLNVHKRARFRSDREWFHVRTVLKRLWRGYSMLLCRELAVAELLTSFNNILVNGLVIEQQTMYK